MNAGVLISSEYSGEQGDPKPKLETKVEPSVAFRHIVAPEDLSVLAADH